MHCLSLDNSCHLIFTRRGEHFSCHNVFATFDNQPNCVRYFWIMDEICSNRPCLLFNLNSSYPIFIKFAVNVDGYQILVAIKNGEIIEVVQELCLPDWFNLGQLHTFIPFATMFLKVICCRWERFKFKQKGLVRKLWILHTLPTLRLKVC